MVIKTGVDIFFFHTYYTVIVIQCYTGYFCSINYVLFSVYFFLPLTIAKPELLFFKSFY